MTSATVWQRLTAEVRAASARVRKEQADYAAGRTGMGFFHDRDRDKSEAHRNVRELYELRRLVDELIDDEIIRGRELGASFDQLGSSRQQAQQRHARALRQRELTKGDGARTDFVNEH